MYMYFYVYIDVQYMNAYVFLSIYIDAYECIRIAMYIYIDAYECICISMYAYIDVYKCIYRCI